jgi:Fe-S-cluster containining protein
LYAVGAPAKLRFDTIIHLYTCPPDCHAFCCVKFNYVDLTDKEYNKLRKLSREKTDKLQIVRYNRTYFHRLDQPCPFLGSDELCTAYNVRPIRCHTYPFSLTDTPSVMQIFPCMMGKKISKDFTEYLIFKMKNDVGIYQTKLDMSSFLGHLDERSNLFYLSTDSNVKTLGVAVSDIFDFLNYLNNMKTVRK